MKKPNGYEDVRATGDYTPVELGGHTAVIKRVKETTSKACNPMIQIAIDFDMADAQTDYFKESFESDSREDKKWPFQGTHYIVTEDRDGNCSRNFKSFITAVEDSNHTECQWGDAFEEWFTGKKVGVVYGENEEEYNGEVRTRRRIRYFCAYDKAKTANVPNKRYLTTAPASPTNSDGFMNLNVPEGTDEEIPF